MAKNSYLNWDSLIEEPRSHEVILENIRSNVEYIHQHPEVYLRKDLSKKGWICPLCGSGTGIHGTGMTEGKGRYKGHFTCWSCGRIGGYEQYHDVIDIIGMVEGIPNRWEATKRAFKIYGLKY